MINAAWSSHIKLHRFKVNLVWERATHVTRQEKPSHVWPEISFLWLVCSLVCSLLDCQSERNEVSVTMREIWADSCLFSLVSISVAKTSCIKCCQDLLLVLKKKRQKESVVFYYKKYMLIKEYKINKKVGSECTCRFAHKVIMSLLANAHFLCRHTPLWREHAGKLMHTHTPSDKPSEFVAKGIRPTVS